MARGIAAIKSATADDRALLSARLTRNISKNSGRLQRCVLGVDPGLDRTGYAVLLMPAARVVEAGVISSSSKFPLARRLTELTAGIEEVLAEHSVDLVAVEDLFAHYRHPRTAILMGHARGVVLLAAARRDIEVVSILPTRVKKALTGNGHAGKVQIQRAISATLKLATLPEPPDVADALAIAWCAAVGHVWTKKEPIA